MIYIFFFHNIFVCYASHVKTEQDLFSHMNNSWNANFLLWGEWRGCYAFLLFGFQTTVSHENILNYLKRFLSSITLIAFLVCLETRKLGSHNRHISFVWAIEKTFSQVYMTKKKSCNAAWGSPLHALPVALVARGTARDICSFKKANYTSSFWLYSWREVWVSEPNGNFLEPRVRLLRLPLLVQARAMPSRYALRKLKHYCVGRTCTTRSEENRSAPRQLLTAKSDVK